MFLNKTLFVCNIAKLSLTIDGIYYVVDDRLGIYHTKHHRNMVTKTKANTKKL
jgi:HrpA-like RNA helicase